MKKSILIFSIISIFGNISRVNAQCYGNVVYDQSVAPAPSSSSSVSFTINTTHCNELIMIGYDGFDFGSTTGTGPITVDGNNATYLNTSSESQSGIYVVASETYAYIAPAPGVHNITINENGYSGTSGYDVNFACDFYATNTVNPLTIASLTSVAHGVACESGGPITGTINTTIPNSMIYDNTCYNDAVNTSDPISWTNGTFLADNHAGYGIEGSDAYTAAAVTGAHSITANNTYNYNYCTGITMVLVAIPPPLCGTPLTATDLSINPTCGNSNGSITVTASGGYGAYTYTWSPNVSTTNSATGLSAGTYSITVSDGNCNVCNPSPLIVTLTGPNITLTTNVTSNEPCFGNSDGSVTAVFAGGTPPFVYNWTPTGGTNATATGLSAGTYTITASDANGCTHTAAVTITQPTALSVTTTPTNILCNGGTGSITANPAGGTSPYGYLWMPGANTNATGAGLTAGTYSITVTDANGCTATASGTLTQPTALHVNVTGPTLLCVGATGTLTANVTGGTAPYAYAWSPGIASITSTATISPVSSQTYTVTVTDANGCQITGQITVDLGTPVTLSVTGSPTICSGMQTTLCVTATGGTGGNIYSWQPGNFSTPCITVSPTSTTVYTVSVADNCGTTTTTTATVSVNPLPAINFSANLYQGCAPLCIQFYNTTTLAQGGPAQYVWTFGNGDSSHVQSPVYCYPSSGKYDVTLTVTSDSGCSSTLKKINMITAYERPNAAFTVSPQPATIMTPTIQFTDKSTDSYNIISWSWNFGDATDSTSNSENTSHTYQDTGTYCANLIVVDEHGCNDTATNCLVIEPAFNLYIPSAFSPNGDGKNEVFAPKGQYIKTFEMYIFDRWGDQVFHSNSLSDGWNGTINGGSEIAPEGTFIYKILVTDSKNKQHTYVGDITLIK